MKKCAKCGGNILFPDGCRLCPMFEAGQTGLGVSPAGWPKESMALAVHHTQVQEATERNRRHGSPVTYKPNGMAIVPDRAARKKQMKIQGLHDNSGGYGD